MVDIPSFNERASILAPAAHAIAITPNDAADLNPPFTRALFIGGAGAVKVDMIGGETVVFSGLAAGTTLSVQVKRVYATGGTTATLMLQLY